VTALPYGNPDSHAFEAIARSLMAGRGLVYQEPMLRGLSFLRLPFARLSSFPGATARPRRRPAGTHGAGERSRGSRRHWSGDWESAWAVHGAWCAWALALTWWPTWVLAGQLLSETLYVTLSVLVLTALVAALRAAAGPAR